MNFLCGLAGKPLQDEAEKVREKLEDLYKVPCRVVDGGDSGFAVYNEGSIITGLAENNNQHLVYLGAIHHPIVDWEGPGTPLDNASATSSHILSLWRKHGTEFIGMASGSFTGCLFDRDSGKSLLFCDLDAMRNLYTYKHENRIWFGNNPFALASVLPKINIDRSFEDFFLVYGFWPDRRTAYSRIELLPTGGVMEINNGEAKFHPVKRYKGIHFPGQDFNFDGSDFDEAVDALYKAFMQAIQDQTSSEKKVAVLLGGVDSALVASCLKRLGKKVETFSFYYDDEAFNQPHTDTLSKYLGISHNWVRITPEVILSGHKNWAQRYCQPTNWANYVIQTSHLCDEIRKKGIIRCYSGDGCDGTFLGYPNVHKRSSVYARTRQLPKWVLALILAPMRYGISEYILSRIYTVACNALRSFARSGPARGLLTFRVMDELSLDRLRDGGRPNQEIPLEEKLKELSKGLTGLSHDRIAYLGKSMVSPNKAKMNGCMDNENVTVLSPYLHPELKKIANRIPDNFLRPETLKGKQMNLGKFILLKMTQKYNLLPDDIIYQPKVAAVDSPVDSWYSNSIKDEMIEVMRGLPFKENKRYIEFLFKEYRIDRLYTKYFSSDSITSHAISLLSTYATYTKGFTE